MFREYLIGTALAVIVLYGLPTLVKSVPISENIMDLRSSPMQQDSTALLLSEISEEISEITRSTEETTPKTFSSTTPTTTTTTEKPSTEKAITTTTEKPRTEKPSTEKAITTTTEKPVESNSLPIVTDLQKIFSADPQNPGKSFIIPIDPKKYNPKSEQIGHASIYLALLKDMIGDKDGKKYTIHQRREAEDILKVLSIQKERFNKLFTEKDGNEVRVDDLWAVVVKDSSTIKKTVLREEEPKKSQKSLRPTTAAPPITEKPWWEKYHLFQVGMVVILLTLVFASGALYCRRKPRRKYPVPEPLNSESIKFLSPYAPTTIVRKPFK